METLPLPVGAHGFLRVVRARTPVGPLDSYQMQVGAVREGAEAYLAL